MISTNTVARLVKSAPPRAASADIQTGPASVQARRIARAARQSLTTMNEALESFKFSPWREWSGGECPLKDYIEPQVRYRSGGETEMQASKIRWSHTGAWDDVVAYRRRLPVMPGFCP